MSCRRPKNRLTLTVAFARLPPEGDDFVSNVIDFLQRLGQDAKLRHAPRAALERALAEAGIDPALREALLGADQKLESLLGADTNVCAMISPGKKEEEEEEDEDFDEDEDDNEDDFDEDEDEDEDDDEDEDEDEDDDDEDEDEEEENSLTPRRSTVRRVG